MLNQSTRVLAGLPGAPGRAAGPALRWGTVAAATVPTGIEALPAAFAAAEARLDAARAGANATLAPLLEAQKLMLGDPEFRDGILALARDGLSPADAVRQVSEQQAAMLAAAESAYFRERAIDVRAVGKLVLEALAGTTRVVIPAGAVVLAEELAPLDTAELAEAGVAALVTLRGGPTCHAAIIARAWGIPAVVGVPADALAIPDGTPVLVDGTAGCLIIAPSDDELAQTTDDEPTICIMRRIPIYANIGSLAEATRAAAAGAEGVGLLRTEFLFQGRATPPSEDEQTAQYTAILAQFPGAPVTIRTLDIGADKPVPFLPLPPEPNPQLGLRGVRLCLQQRELFTTQLRALVRASTAGQLKIMLPMVTTPDEVREVRGLVQTIADELHITPPPLGAMIEVPLAALSGPELADVCDFFSVGTNDLLQFLLAADRQHAGVGYLHTGDHPAAWRLIAGVIDDAHNAGIRVGICGEWGADPEKLARLVALGIDTVSVAVAALPRVQQLFPDGCRVE